MGKPLRPIRALTFDLDDTLWPVLPVIEHAEQTLQRWLAQHCPRVIERWDIEAIRSLRAQVAERRPDIAHDFSAQRVVTLRHVLSDCGSSTRLVDRAFAVFFEARHQVDLYPDVHPTLNKLAERYPLAALTNGNANPHRIGLKMFAFCLHARHYDPKPEATLFDAARDRLAVDAEQLVHVGDHPEQDVMAARSAGFQAIWVNRKGQSWCGDGEPPLSVQSLAEIPALLADSNSD